MRATLMYKSGDVRVEEVPDPTISAPTDALVRAPTPACAAPTCTRTTTSRRPPRDGGWATRPSASSRRSATRSLL